MDDPRLKITDKGVSIVGLAQEDPLKVAVYSPLGWAAIEFPEGYTLIKRVTALAPSVYPDFNTNWQCYVAISLSRSKHWETSASSNLERHLQFQKSGNC
jgi:hypothetical protein